MSIALTLEELLGPSLAEAKEEIVATFRTLEELRKHREKALLLPKVKDFRLALEYYLERAEQLAEQLAGDHGIIMSAFQNGKGSTELRHAWQVMAMCYHNHAVPKEVATISIPVEEIEQFTSPEDALRHIRFTHAYLTDSYHSQRIDQNGRIICREHGIPATLEVSAKVHRLVPKPKQPPQVIENLIVQELANRFNGNGNGNGHGSRKHEQNLEEVRRNLEVLLRVGEDGIYNSIYEALEQTRHRAVTAWHIAKNADLDGLTERFKRFVGYDAATRTLTPEQLAQHLRGTDLFKALQELAKRIPSPVVVTLQRTKGQSLVDKATIAEHYQQLLEAFDGGELQAYFRRLSLPVPDRMKDERKKKNPPNLDDAVGVQVLVHGDGLDYDPSDFRMGTPKLSPKEVEEVRGKCYGALAVVGGIPHKKMGYERMEPEQPTNGKKPTIKQRMPPDPENPKFRDLDPNRPNGLVVDLTPSPKGKFDDYFVQPKKSGYMALQTVVGSSSPDLEGAAIELQIKPNVIAAFEKLAANESHERYQLERAVQIRFLLETGRMSPMEWAINQLLLTPPGKIYRETPVNGANGNGRTYANLRRLVAAGAGAK